MTHFISPAALLLHRVLDPDSSRPALSGIHVDPTKGIAMATDGKRLIEVGLPEAEGFQADGHPLMNGKAAAFLIPKETAQVILKALPKTPPKDAKSAAHLHAAIAHSKGEGKVTILAGLPGNLTPITFAPIDAQFPEITDQIWPAKPPKASISMNPALLASTLRAVVPDESKEEPGTVTIHVFDDRIVVQAESPDGTRTRAVQMAISSKASSYETAGAKPKASAVKASTVVPSTPSDQSDKGEIAKPAPVAKGKLEKSDSPAAASVPNTAPRTNRRFHRWGRFRKDRPFVSKPGDPAKAPTDRQRMLYTYLLRRHGRQITPELLGSTDFVGKIETLKEGLAFDPEFATWNQWLKVNYLLLDRKADAVFVCEILNGIAGKKTASEAIVSLSDQAATAAA